MAASESHNYAHLLLNPSWKAQIQQWLKDDVPGFDYGGFVVGETMRTARLLGKSPGVIAGVPFAAFVFAEMECEVEWLMGEGDVITAEMAASRVVVAKVTGKVRNVLLAERTALNIMARASGIATLTKKIVDSVRAVNWKGQVAATRKTTPGFGLIEKYAVLVGGGSTHRMNLASMVMLKDNHIWSTGSITESVVKAKRVVGFSTKIEVECSTLADAREASLAGADVCMLDNFVGDSLQVAASALKAEFPHVVVEASGGITAATIATYVCDSVDVVSMGCLTQGYGFVDFSLKVTPPASAP
jgi:nicotinate-nucleotide pyrophosphorylase (carboxylating)